MKDKKIKVSKNEKSKTKVIKRCTKEKTVKGYIHGTVSKSALEIKETFDEVYNMVLAGSPDGVYSNFRFGAYSFLVHLDDSLVTLKKIIQDASISSLPQFINESVLFLKSLATISSIAICRNKFNDLTTENLLKVKEENVDLLIRKNNDYGDNNLVKHGLFGIVVRMDDKLSRLQNIVEKKNMMVNDETMNDTLMDIAGYAVNGIRLLRSNKIGAGI